jgi:hypothetical protein
MFRGGVAVACEQRRGEAVLRRLAGILVMEPNISWRPIGWAAARPSAQAICRSSRPSSRPFAAALPNTPVVPVMCQPIS